MANTTETVDGKLLWLRPAAASARTPTGKVGAIERALLASARPVDSVDNVYHALLHLIWGQTGDYLSAIVCVDEMEHAELEFFTILAQRSHCPPIYAYGHERSQSVLGRAVELGSAGVATPELVTALVARTAPRTPPALERDTPPPAPNYGVEPVDAPPGAPAAGPPRDQEPPPPDAAVEHETDDAESDEPARVPWRTYDTVSRHPPRRQPPPPRTPPGPAPSESKPAPADDYESTPLLTDEELRALIGDDDSGADRTGHDTHGP